MSSSEENSDGDITQVSVLVNLQHFPVRMSAASAEQEKGINR